MSADGVAPMSLTTYEEARPWARAIKQRTGMGPRAGVMPPWYVEKNIGIQKFHNDPSLSDAEVAKIANTLRVAGSDGNLQAVVGKHPRLPFEQPGRFELLHMLGVGGRENIRFCARDQLRGQGLCAREIKGDCSHDRRGANPLERWLQR